MRIAGRSSVAVTWLALVAAATGLPGQSGPKRILFVTHSAGFRHSSIEVARQVLQDVAAQSGKMEVVATEDLSLLSADRLRNFDAVLFFTSGELALSNQQKSGILEFVRSGGGFGGVHSATDTLYSWPEYGALIGGVFDGHPWVQEASIDVEDGAHPVSKDLAPAWRLTEEFYQFREFSRDRVRVLMTLDTRSVDLKADGVHRADKDFALGWVHRYGAGRVFYSALGHFDETWRDPRFQQVMRNGLLWITGLVDGDASIPARGPVASALPEFVAPGAALEIYGTGLTTGSTLAANPLDWKYRLAGTRVLVNGSDVPIYYASPTQVNVQFPMDLGIGASAEVSVSIGEKVFEMGRVPVFAAAPAIRGVRSVAGSVEIYATGLGAVEGNSPTGAVAPVDRIIRTREVPRVRIGGRDAVVEFAGLAPGWVALYQVNAIVPAGVRGTNIVIEIEAAGKISRTTAEF